MAKKIKTRLDDIENFVSNEEKIVEDIIKPAIVDHLADKIRYFRDKGYSDNQIAGLVQVPKDVVKKTK